MRRSSLVIAGKLRETERFDVIKNPYTGEPVSEVSVAGANDLDRAIQCASDARRACSALSAQARAAACDAVARALESERDSIARLIAEESGKPIRYARAEVTRAVTTFTLGAGVARTLGGEVMPADVSAGG